MANWDSLRRANEARQIEWTGNKLEDLTWRGCELGGEIGEVIDEVMAFSTSGDNYVTRTALAGELADGVICVDLTRMTLNLSPLPIVSLGSIDHGGAARECFLLARRTFRLQNMLKKMERERRGWPGSRANVEEVDNLLRSINGSLGLFADYYGVDLKAAVVDTFNATSRKVGLTTLLTGME